MKNEDDVNSNSIWPGAKVVVYDHMVKKHRSAVVCKRYGELAKQCGPLALGPYDDLVDVQFKDGKMSRGHFTSGVRLDS